MHLLVFTGQTFWVCYLNSTFALGTLSKIVFSVLLILLNLISNFLNCFASDFFHEFLLLLFFLFGFGFCFLSLLVVLDRQVVTLWLDFKEVVRSDLLEPLDHVSSFNCLGGLFPPESRSISTLLGSGKLSKHLSLILESFKQVSSQLGFVI